MSQTTPETTTIGGKTYTMYMLPPMQSHDLLMDVAKMVGPSIGPVLDTVVGMLTGGGIEQAMDTELGPSFFTKAAGAFFGGVDKKVIRDTIEAFKGVSEVNGAPLKGIFDAHFMGALEEMYQWVAWGMRVQWGKSLSALVAGLKDKGAIMAARKQDASPLAPKV